MNNSMCGISVTPKELELFNSGEFVDSWACDFNPELKILESNGGQEFLIRDENGVIHSFICDWGDYPILYNGIYENVGGR